MNRFRLGSFFISIVLASMVSIIYFSCSPRVSQVKMEETATLEVNDVRLSDNPDKTEVIVSGSGHIPYTTFRLTDPPRLILDLAGTSLGNFKEKIEAKGGEVVSIIPKEGQKPNMVSRVEIVLTGLAESNVRRDRDNLIVEILKTPARAEEAREGRGIPEEAKAEIKGLEPQMIEEKVLPPARNISKIDIDKTEKGIKVTVTGDGEMKPNTFIVGERRLVFDIPDTMSQVKPTSIQVDHPILKRIRIGQHKDPEKVRIVFDLNKLTPYIVDKKGDQFIVFLGESIPTKVTTEERQEEARKEAPKVAEAPLPETKPAEMIPVTKEEVPAPLETKKEVFAEIPKVISPPNKEVSADKGAGAAKKEGHEEVKEGSSDASGTREEIVQSEVTPQASAKEEKVEEKLTEDMEKKEVVKSLQTGKRDEVAFAKRYKGRRISLDFQDAEITSILRLLADISAKNMVIAEDVKGKMTLKLLNVPWDQALDIVLKMNNLGKVEEESVIRIGTLGSLARQQEEEAKAKESMIKAEDLITKVININYAKAQELSDSVKKNLSARGDITIDGRTNSMIIKDVEKIIVNITELIKVLDTPTPQVMIEAKIVQAQPQFARAIGIQWGADFQDSLGSTGSVGLRAGPTGTFGTPSTTFGVNLPSASPTGTLGFTFGRLTQRPINLDLRLSASEFKGLTKIISSPKIATIDNQEAKIEQGETIPFATVSQQGTQTTFVDANLTLAVTPHVTPDGSILMKVKATKNAPGTTRQGAAGPSITKKEAITNVLVKDGETIVIGGIYETTKTENTNRIPFLSNIPILGWFFKEEDVSELTTELLVFVTPKIIK